jgi:uncharacterized protein (DUF983 family)
MGNEQPLLCAKCNRMTLHRAVDNAVMKCNACEPAISKTREDLHTLIWVVVAILCVVGGLAVCGSI